MDWNALIQASSMQRKWEAFINIYEEGVKRYVPTIDIYNNEWYNRRCEIMREEEKAWQRWRRRSTQQLW